MKVNLNIEDVDIETLQELVKVIDKGANGLLLVPNNNISRPGQYIEVPDCAPIQAEPVVNAVEPEKPQVSQPAISIEEMRSRITDFCKADMKVNPGKIQSFFNSLGVESLPQVPKEKYGELLKIMGVA